MPWIRAVVGDTFGWRWDDPARGKYGEHFVPAKFNPETFSYDWETPPSYTPIPLDNVGAGINTPLTSNGQPVFATTQMGANGPFDAINTYFAQGDPNMPAGAQPAMAGGYSSDNGATGLGSFLEPLVIGGLGAIAAAPVAAAAGGGVLGGAVGGAAGGALSGGIASEFDPQSMLQGSAIGGTLGGALNALLPAPEVANSGMDFGGQGVGWSPETITGATPTLSESPVAQSFPVSQPVTLQDLLAQSPSITTDVTAPLTGPFQMPAAVPEVDPTFGGTLTQTGPGQYENLTNIINFGTPGSSLPSGTPPGLDIAPNAVTTPTAAPLPDAGMDLGAFTDPNPYTSGVTQSQINSAAAQGAAANVAAGAGGIAPVATTALTAAGAGIGATKLSDILNGNVGLGDLASQFTLGNLGNLLGTAASVYGANEQANKLKAMYDQYLSLGAPSRQRYEASFQPGFDITSDPVFKSAMDASTDALLRRGSVGGNPYGNPGVLAEIQKYTTSNVALPYLQNYRNQNAATGGYNAFNTAAPGTGGAAVQAGGEVYSDIGRGIGRIMNPQPTLQDFFNQSRMGSLT